jgi:hypothetical protein
MPFWAIFAQNGIPNFQVPDRNQLTLLLTHKNRGKRLAFNCLQFDFD